MYYFDHAASSFPKPKRVAEAMADAVLEYGANPGRSGHRLSKQAEETILNARKEVASLINAPSVDGVIFCQNATQALNILLKGFPWEKGDHIISTAFEHNSVRRPLQYLQRKIGITVTYIDVDIDGNWDFEALDRCVTNETKAIVTSHGSNVTGTLVDLLSLQSWVKQRNLYWFVDGSQTVGSVPLDMTEYGIDAIAFPGHKGLLGPQGTGVLVIGHDLNIMPLIHGGTGSFSENADMPKQLPYRLEGGTLNTPGIAGLLAGIEEVIKRGVANIYEHERSLALQFVEGLADVEDVNVIGPSQKSPRLGVVSFSLKDIDSHEIAMILDQHYDMAVRGGIHCSPLIHQRLQTVDKGLVRASFGPYNTREEIDKLIEAIKEIKVGLIG